MSKNKNEGNEMYLDLPMEDGENKFHMLHMLIERVKTEGGTIRVLAPEDLGDDYDEIVDNLNLISKAGVPLIIGN